MPASKNYRVNSVDLFPAFIFLMFFGFPVIDAVIVVL